MARKVGQIIARGDRRWLFRVYLAAITLKLSVRSFSTSSLIFSRLYRKNAANIRAFCETFNEGFRGRVRRKKLHKLASHFSLTITVTVSPSQSPY